MTLFTVLSDKDVSLAIVLTAGQYSPLSMDMG